VKQFGQSRSRTKNGQGWKVLKIKSSWNRKWKFEGLV
jgi:hypothetical protein